MVTRAVLALAVVLAIGPATHADGDPPVVVAARQALRTGDFGVVAPWVERRQEPVLLAAFQHTRLLRGLGTEARTIGERYFVDTALRLHRDSHGAARSDVDRAVDSGDIDELADAIAGAVRANLRARFHDLADHAPARRGDVEGGRAYVARYTDLVRYVAALYTAATAAPRAVEEPLPYEQ